MHLRRLTITISLVAAIAVPVAAQQAAISEEDYDAAMKQIRATVGGVGDHMTAESGSDVAADGKALAELFAQVETFWEARGTDDAKGWASTALAAARELETAGSSGNFEAAGTAFGNLRGTCRPCHQVHRERTDDGFRIKSGS